MAVVGAGGASPAPLSSSELFVPLMETLLPALDTTLVPPLTLFPSSSWYGEPPWIVCAGVHEMQFSMGCSSVIQSSPPGSAPTTGSHTGPAPTTDSRTGPVHAIGFSIWSSASSSSVESLLPISTVRTVSPPPIEGETSRYKDMGNTWRQAASRVVTTYRSLVITRTASWRVINW